MANRITANASERSADEQAARDIAYTWEHRYWHAMDNAKRCKRLARSVMTDERLFLGLQQLAEDYESLASWLRRH